MALVVVATPGASDANSYLTRAEADTYFESRLHTDDWNDASTATKDKAIVMATRLLDSMYDWVQFPTDQTQALQWPRVGVVDFNELEYIEDNVIPDRLKWATAELAMLLIAEDRTLDYDVESKGVSSFSAGPVSFSFKSGVYSKIIPDSVYHLIPDFWGKVRSRYKRVHALGRG
jgi:hypothetical protein